MPPHESVSLCSADFQPLGLVSSFVGRVGGWRSECISRLFYAARPDLMTYFRDFNQAGLVVFVLLGGRDLREPRWRQ